MAPGQRRTVNIHIGRKLYGKTRVEILDAVIKCFQSRQIIAVQQFPDTIRVTFDLEETAIDVLKVSSGVRLFDMWCRMDGGPPSTIIHLFDFPYEEGCFGIEDLFKAYGTVKAVRQQKYLSNDNIFTGTRLIDLVLERHPPRLVSLNGYVCRVWYKGQPLICNSCGVQGHRASECPDKDKCRICREAGHLARNCPNPRGPAGANEENTSRDDGNGSNASGNVPASEENTSRNDGNVPASEENTSRVDGNGSNAPGNVPASEENISRDDGNGSNAPGNEPVIEENSSRDRSDSSSDMHVDPILNNDNHGRESSAAPDVVEQVDSLSRVSVIVNLEDHTEVVSEVSSSVPIETPNAQDSVADSQLSAQSQSLFSSQESSSGNIGDDEDDEFKDASDGSEADIGEFPSPPTPFDAHSQSISEFSDDSQSILQRIPAAKDQSVVSNVNECTSPAEVNSNTAVLNNVAVNDSVVSEANSVGDSLMDLSETRKRKSVHDSEDHVDESVALRPSPPQSRKKLVPKVSVSKGVHSGLPTVMPDRPARN